MQLGNKKRRKENKTENYKMESIHKDILGFLTTFALRITQANSVLNRSLTDSIAGCLSLKMKSFLSIQMHQLNIMIISIKKLTPSCTLNDSRISKRGPRGRFRLRRPQAACAKEHSRNKCSKVSSTCN
jgi:hypothetical protein